MHSFFVLVCGQHIHLGEAESAESVPGNTEHPLYQSYHRKTLNINSHDSTAEMKLVKKKKKVFQQCSLHNLKERVTFLVKWSSQWCWAVPLFVKSNISVAGCRISADFELALDKQRNWLLTVATPQSCRVMLFWRFWNQLRRENGSRLMGSSCVKCGANRTTVH